VSRSDSSTLLDGSASHDPDVCPPSSPSSCADSALSFEWSCVLADGSPCRLRATNEVVVLASTPLLAVDMPALALENDPTVEFTVTVQKQGRFEEATVLLNLEDGPVAQVHTSRLRCANMFSRLSPAFEARFWRCSFKAWS